MNILIDLLPVKVDINGVEYAINSDFRTSILFSLLMDDDRLTEDAKVMQALVLYYPKIPDKKYWNEAVERLMWFYQCGKEISAATIGKGKSDKKRILDYEVDADYIYSAFMSQYRIDLQDVSLHWWKFKSLLDAINEDTSLFKIMQYRSTDISKITDKEQKKFYKDMQKIYSIEKPDMEDLQLLEEWNSKLK